MKKENIKTIIRWLEDEGTINYMDGRVYQLSDGEFEEYYKENRSDFKSRDEYAIYLCRNALEEAGIEEEIIKLCLDWDSQESTDKALEYFKRLERSSL